ncbi:MAG: hypothetical protein ACLTF1_12790 [Clostridium sp.]
MLSLNVPNEEMRLMLRISHSSIDPELESLKASFLIDLELCGVGRIPADDPLAKSALRMYLRWQENYNGEAERYKEAYTGLKIAMSLAEEYKAVKV